MVFTREFGERTKRLALSSLVLSLSSCANYIPQRYSVSADNNVALKSTGVGNINVGPFKGDDSFDENCRGAGPIGLPGMAFETYLQKALADELKVAGMLDEKSPKVVLSGVVEHLDFSTMSPGYWNIDLRVNSTNGKSVFVRERYEFPSALIGDNACRNAADAYFPAVQDLIGKLVTSPEFKALVTP